MRFGYFATKKREYVITDPRTPVKWINYLGTRSFGGFVDHTGGALICKDDPTFNRITRYLQGTPASDFKGETLYIRLPTPQGYRVFSPFFVPTLEPLDRFECHVGLGYSHWVSEAYGLRVEITAFVPQRDPCEIRRVCVTNMGQAPIEVDVVPVVEYTHPDALRQLTNADWVPQTMQSRAVRDGPFLVLTQFPFMLRDTRLNFLTSNLPAASFETDRRRFLGDYEYGSFRNPASLFRPELSDSQAERGDTVGVLLHHFGALPPQETRVLVTQLGQTENLEAAHPQIERYRRIEAVEEELERLQAFWDRYLAVLQVDTPDPDTNTMLNVHHPYQCHVNLTWSRYLSTYQTGLGARGIGLRDSLQDVLAAPASAPQESRAFLATLLAFQKRDGSSLHQFNPLTLEGSEGDSREMADRPHYYSDDHLWAVLAVSAYLKESLDLAYLEELVPYYDKDRSGRPVEVGTVIDHLHRSLAFTGGDVGAHGLPRLGFADWNDTVNLATGAESVFSALLYGKALREAMDLLTVLGDESAAEAYRMAYAQMRVRVEQAAWDGDWYIGYFDADGRALGSRQNEHSQVQLNPQAWSVISGFASTARARRAMDAVHARLNTRYGVKLSAPGFNGYDPRLGGVSTYPPGAKENGGIFLHPNAWAVIAECLLGNGDRAYAYYTQINPATRNDLIEVYECEPYVYAQNILGDEHPQFGLARNSWLTGTASWAYQAATQWILGIRPEYEGLRIDPCLPSSWSGFKARRAFRGRIFDISVVNPDRVCRGVAEMKVDGERMPGSIVGLDVPAGEHAIEVRLGGRSAPTGTAWPGAK
jgi:cellobiose phosphorylase